jgi:serine/threonine protein kinase
MIPSKEFEQNVCKVVDFGTARFFSTASGASTANDTNREVVGSPAFMSPEQCMEEELAHRSDVYSLGCMMYQATSRPASVQQVKKQLLNLYREYLEASGYQ